MATDEQVRVGREIEVMLALLVKDAVEADLTILAQSLELGLAILRFELRGKAPPAD